MAITVDEEWISQNIGPRQAVMTHAFNPINQEAKETCRFH